MTNEELLDKIFSVEATVCEALGNMQVIISRITELTNRMNLQQDEIERIRTIVDNAITTAVHELIEYLRCNDIQDLDEEEFSVRVSRLIFDADPASYLPF